MTKMFDVNLSTGGTGLTSLMLFISVATFQLWAAIVAIVAGIITGSFTLWRWRNEYLKERKKKLFEEQQSKKNNDVGQD